MDLVWFMQRLKLEKVSLLWKMCNFFFLSKNFAFDWWYAFKDCFFRATYSSWSLITSVFGMLLFAVLWCLLDVLTLDTLVVDDCSLYCYICNHWLQCGVYIDSYLVLGIWNFLISYFIDCNVAMEPGKWKYFASFSCILVLHVLVLQWTFQWTQRLWVQWSA